MHSVMITGGAGNLGGKLAERFANSPWCSEVVVADREEALRRRTSRPDARTRAVAIDLAHAGAEELARALAGVDTVVHFAVLDPAPDASWADSSASVGMTTRLLLAARDAGLRRFVFASSNHTVGALKDGEPIAPGSLTTDKVAPGTRMRVAGGFTVGTAYGASKALSEQVCMAAARDDFTTVTIRIGWCQSGENRPQTLSAGGNPNTPAMAPATAQDERDLKWFRDMWLSNRDFAALFERAVVAPAEGWPAPGIVVNGMSRNTGMPWDIATTRRLLGYEPQDDVWSELKET